MNTPTDLLEHAITHGVSSDPFYFLRFNVDASDLLAKLATLRAKAAAWDEVHEHARNNEVTNDMLGGLFRGACVQLFEDQSND